MALSRKTVAEEEHRLRFVVRAAVEQNCLRKEEEEMHWIDPLKVEAAFHLGGWLEWREP